MGARYGCAPARLQRRAPRLIGSCIDITERRQAEEALRANEAALRQSHAEIEDLAGRLITAQESERARIARDLHDDISQQLAAISIAMSECRRQPELQASGELLEVVTGVQRQAIALAEDIRLLSHDLHPGALEHADLVDALRSHCSEFAKQHSLKVVVEADGDLAIPDMTTALCLYRVVQEALRNIAKHANAGQVRHRAARRGTRCSLRWRMTATGSTLRRRASRAAVSACAASKSGSGWRAGGSRSRQRRIWAQPSPSG